MEDAQGQKLFEKYSQNCAWMIVGKDGNIIKSRPVTVEAVKVDRVGSIAVEWQDSIYDDPRTHSLNVIAQSSYNNIGGIFNSEDIAKDAALQYFKRLKEEKIANLEAELKLLREE